MADYEREIVTWYVWGKPIEWILSEFERRHGRPLPHDELVDILVRHDAALLYPRYGTLIPWSIDLDHDDDPISLMLTAESRRRRGKGLAPELEARLDGWIEGLREADLVVDYSVEAGWSLVPRRADVDHDIIREPPPMPA